MARNPAIPLSAKLAAVDEIASSLEASDLAKRLLAMLTENYRLPHLANVTAAVRQEVKQRLGIINAQVTSAVPLEESQTLQLRQMLESSLGKKVELEVSVEPALLGGFVAQVGSRRYDVSLKGQLERMTEEMAAATA
jgi:F-type H+-transporting ATPase subunit delta